MAHLVITALMATAIVGFSVFLVRFFASRKEIWKLQAAKVPMPKFHPVFGHFIAVKKCIEVLPRNCTFHVVMLQMAKQFPQGIFYISLWPFSKTLLVVATPFASTQVEDAHLHKPGEINEKLDVITGGPSLVTMHGDVWKRWRTLFNPGFSAGYMIGLAPAIADEVAVFCELLQKRSTEGKVFQLEEYTLRLTLDIIARITLGTRLHYQTQDSPLADSLRTLVKWITWGTTFNPVRRYLSPRPIVQWYMSHRMNQHLNAEIDNTFKEYAASVGSSTTRSQTRSKSMISLALEQYFSDVGDNEKTAKEFKEIARSQLRMFLYSGHDTTSSTLLYCYYLLSTHPSILSKVREEHDAVFGTDFSIENIRQAITKDAYLLNQIPYTSAVLKEVLRIYPPAGSMREGRRDFTIVDEEGNRYPTEGCNVWTLSLVLHHSPEVFVRPEEFLPQRWLVGAEDPLYPVKGSWRAFEWGQRNCIGQTLATLELRIALVMTLRMFNIDPAYDEWDKQHPRKGITTVEGHRIYQAEMGGGGAHPVDGVPVRVTLRD